MKRLVGICAFGLTFALFSGLLWRSHLQADDSSKPAVVVSLVKVDVSKGLHAHKIENRRDRPVWLQAQPESGVGYLVQKHKLVDGKTTSDLEAPNGISLGAKSVRLDAHQSLEFVYELGASPTHFRLGVYYALSSNSDQWTLGWGGWWDRR